MMRLLVAFLFFIAAITALSSSDIQSRVISASESSAPATIRNCEPGRLYCFSQIMSEFGKSTTSNTVNPPYMLPTVPFSLPIVTVLTSNKVSNIKTSYTNTAETSSPSTLSLAMHARSSPFHFPVAGQDRAHGSLCLNA